MKKHALSLLSVSLLTISSVKATNILETEAVEGTNGKLTTGGYYSVKSRSSNKYLDGRGSTSDEQVYVTNRNPQGDHVLNWIIESVGDGYYALKGRASNKYLDGRSSTFDEKVFVANRKPHMQSRLT